MKRPILPTSHALRPQCVPAYPMSHQFEIAWHVASFRRTPHDKAICDPDAGHTCKASFATRQKGCVSEKSPNIQPLQSNYLVFWRVNRLQINARSLKACELSRQSVSYWRGILYFAIPAYFVSYHTNWHNITKLREHPRWNVRLTTDNVPYHNIARRFETSLVWGYWIFMGRVGHFLR